MNFARKAFDGGGTLRFYDARQHGAMINDKRQAKKALGLSGRQLKKLRKAARREQRAQLGETALKQVLAGTSRRPPSPRPGP